MKLYHELLKDAIKGSQMTLDEISSQLSERGFSTKKHYLSALQNGKVAPAADMLNRALADILKIDEQELMIAGDFAKATPTIQALLSDTFDLESMLITTLEALFKQIAPYALLDLDSISNLTAKGYNPYDTNEFMQQLQQKSSLVEKWTLYQECFEAFHFSNNKEDNSIQISLKNSHENNLNRYATQNDSDKLEMIPVLSTIYADQHFFEQDIIEHKSLSVQAGIKYFFLKIIDDSMIQDGIEPNDLLLVKTDSELHSTDIAIIAIENNPAIVRKVLFHENLCILHASNPSIAPIVIDANNVSVIGKAIEVWKKKKLSM